MPEMGEVVQMILRSRVCFNLGASWRFSPKPAAGAPSVTIRTRRPDCVLAVRANGGGDSLGGDLPEAGERITAALNKIVRAICGRSRMSLSPPYIMEKG